MSEKDSISKPVEKSAESTVSGATCSAKLLQDAHKNAQSSSKSSDASQLKSPSSAHLDITPINKVLDTGKAAPAARQEAQAIKPAASNPSGCGSDAVKTPGASDKKGSDSTAVKGSTQAPPESTAAKGSTQAPPESTAAKGNTQAPPESTAAKGSTQAPPESTSAKGNAQAAPESTAVKNATNPTAAVPAESPAPPAAKGENLSVPPQLPPDVPLFPRDGQPAAPSDSNAKNPEYVEVKFGASVSTGAEGTKEQGETNVKIGGKNGASIDLTTKGALEVTGRIETHNSATSMGAIEISAGRGGSELTTITPTASFIDANQGNLRIADTEAQKVGKNGSALVERVNLTIQPGGPHPTQENAMILYETPLNKDNTLKAAAGLQLSHSELRDATGVKGGTSPGLEEQVIYRAKDNSIGIKVDAAEGFGNSSNDNRVSVQAEFKTK